jgi:hypothetical protein
MRKNPRLSAMCWRGAAILAVAMALGPPVAHSQPVEASAGAADAGAGGAAERPDPEPPPLPEPEGATRLTPQDRVWIDVKNHEVFVDGYVALQRGYLEMFACPAGTKEHESVVGVHSKAATVHAALLAVGAVEGHPARFRPEFSPPAGTEIEIEVRWQDAEQKWRTARAQEWVREVESKKEMSHDWVFAGSGFWTNEKTGERYYMAEQGDLICVSNFPGATLDVPFESTQSNEGLLFEAFTERIPKLGTPVRLVLKPVLDKEQQDKPEKPRSAAGDEAAEQPGSADADATE